MAVPMLVEDEAARGMGCHQIQNVRLMDQQREARAFAPPRDAPYMHQAELQP